MTETYKEMLIGGIKAAILLMGFSTLIAIFWWVGMFLVSFIPIIGQGPKALYSLYEIMIFWAGIICGLLSLFMVAALTKKEIILKDRKSSGTQTLATRTNDE